MSHKDEDYFLIKPKNTINTRAIEAITMIPMPRFRGLGWKEIDRRGFFVAVGDTVGVWVENIVGVMVGGFGVNVKVGVRLAPGLLTSVGMIVPAGITSNF